MEILIPNNKAKMKKATGVRMVVVGISFRSLVIVDLFAILGLKKVSIF